MVVVHAFEHDSGVTSLYVVEKRCLGDISMYYTVIPSKQSASKAGR
jgi:hypothetical protein